jgi:hypothetical protein
MCYGNFIAAIARAFLESAEIKLAGMAAIRQTYTVPNNHPFANKLLMPETLLLIKSI